VAQGPRKIERPVLPQGPLADLKNLVYELYLAAGGPTLNTIGSWIVTFNNLHPEDKGLPGQPGRDTIGRIIGDAGIPPSQADMVTVVTVLARAARWDTRDVVRRACDLWVAAYMARPVGVPLEDAADPFALEVHRPFEPEGVFAGLPLLPPYVLRVHDGRLAQVVARAVEGISVMAVLVAGSSAGKTRACWEALEPLRRVGGWRLWHPRDPDRPEAALEGLPQVGPRTVVWLNEAQEYFGGGNGERVAAMLRSLLADPARAPVLVLGTLWPEHHDTLTRNPASQVRLLLDGTVIEVPAAFASADLSALRRAGKTDPRLAQAVLRAEDGQVAQYLAGGPALLERFSAAPPAAKAMICAAMDARRLGMGPALPLAFLEDAALGYLPGTEMDALSEDWAQQALVYSVVPCKGTRGPLTCLRRSVRPRRSRNSLDQESDTELAYRLADYLDQHGRTQRARQIPPPEFWLAAAAHAVPDDQAALAAAAYSRGLYQDAAQLRKNAAACGNARAACALVASPIKLDPVGASLLRWSAEIDFSDADEAAQQIDRLVNVDDLGRGVIAAAVRLAEAMRVRLPKLRPADPRAARWAAAHISLSDPARVADLLDSLRIAGAGQHIVILLGRDPAVHADLADLVGVASLLDSLLMAGAGEQAAALASRAVAHADLSDLAGVASLLRSLRKVGVGEQATALLSRDPAAHARLGNPGGVASLLSSLREAGAGERVAALLARDPAAHADLSKLSGVSLLLASLQDAGAGEQAAALASRAAAHADLSNPDGVASLLDSLRIAGAGEQVAALLARDPAAHADLSDPGGVALLLNSLRNVGAGEQAAALASRAAAHADLSDSDGVAHLLNSLREASTAGQAAMLLGRDPAAHANLTKLSGVARLLNSLQDGGAGEQAAALASRATAHANLRDSDPSGVAELLDSLRAAGAGELAIALASRAAVHANLGSLYPYGAARLLDSLRAVGAGEEAAMLTAQLPAAGMFVLFLEEHETWERFRFGREADGTPAGPWDWEDLD
jgi:uncharacterized protein YidB (DUF937 family)